MKIAINVGAAVVVLFACAPAFAHGGGMGHMGGNMGSNMGNNMGNMSHQTVVHDGDHHNSMNSQFIKTTKTIGKTNKTHTTRLKFFSSSRCLECGT